MPASERSAHAEPGSRHSRGNRPPKARRAWSCRTGTASSPWEMASSVPRIDKRVFAATYQPSARRAGFGWRGCQMKGHVNIPAQVNVKLLAQKLNALAPKPFPGLPCGQSGAPSMGTKEALDDHIRGVDVARSGGGLAGAPRPTRRAPWLISPALCVCSNRTCAGRSRATPFCYPASATSLGPAVPARVDECRGAAGLTPGQARSTCQ